MTETNSVISIAGMCAFVTDTISSQSIATHTHAIALFALYLFIRYYRTTKNEGHDVSEKEISLKHSAKNDHNSAKVSSVSTTKVRASSISYSTLQEESKSSTPQSSSPEKKDFEFDDAQLSRVEKNTALQKGSTPAERRRFFLASKGNEEATITTLNHYLQWNRQHVGTKREKRIRINPTKDRDYDLWVESCLTAMSMCGEVENIVLPRIIRRPPRATTTPDFVDSDGHRAFCLRPALMDLRLAKGSTYTLAVAIYIDRSCNREELEKITVCLDVRAGRGWPNTHVLRLIPFIKESANVLLPLFPERLHKALVYPVPYAFFYVWRMISKCLDEDTVSKVCIVEGKCKIEAPPPNEKLRVHLGEEELRQLEACRIDTFEL